MTDRTEDSEIIHRVFGGKYKYVRHSKSVYFVDDKSIVIKKSRNAINEYNAGMELNKLNKDYFVRTYEHVYDSETNKYFLVNELAQGVNLHNYLCSFHCREEKQILLLLSYICMEMSELGITHYDLHANNIIVKKLTRPHKYTFSISGKTIVIRSHLLIRIIDYEFMHIKNMPLTDINIDEVTLCNGIMPFCFDPSYDICTIMGSIWPAIGFEIIKFKRLATDNGFNLTFSTIGEILPGREYTFKYDNESETNWISISNTDINRLSLHDSTTKLLMKYKMINISSRKHDMKTLFEAIISKLQIH